MIRLKAEGPLGGGKTSILVICRRALVEAGYIVDHDEVRNDHTLYVRTLHELRHPTRTGLVPPTGPEG